MKSFSRLSLLIVILAILTLLIGCQTNTTTTSKFNLEQFTKRSEDLRDNFKPEGYVEITSGWGIKNFVPSFEKESKENHRSFQDNNKTLVYNNEKLGIVTMVGISPAETDEEKWTNVLHYIPNFYNSNDKDDEENGITQYYSDKFSNTEVTVLNFTSNGLNVSIVSISDGSNPEDVYTHTVKFYTSLLNYLKSKK